MRKLNIKFVYIVVWILTSRLYAAPTPGPTLLLKFEKGAPGQTKIASCKGDFLGRKNDEGVVFFDKATNVFRVVWISAQGAIQELDRISKKNVEKFELQCMNPKEADQLRKAAEQSEGIHAFLKFPKGNGLFCYFQDDVNAKCWTFDKGKGTLVDAGGWQT
jgi:hypothetical protein